MDWTRSPQNPAEPASLPKIQAWSFLACRSSPSMQVVPDSPGPFLDTRMHRVLPNISPWDFRTAIISGESTKETPR